MKLFLMRHGETNYNVLGLTNSDPSVDVHLSENGIAQVEAKAEEMKDTPIDQIFVSELPRTRQTADIMNKYHDAPIVVDERLGDIRTGFEGKPSDPYFAALEASEDKWNASFNDGESREDVRRRVRSFVDELKKANYSSVLVVTSRDVVSALFGEIKNVSSEEAWSRHVDKASCLEVEL